MLWLAVVWWAWVSILRAAAWAVMVCWRDDARNCYRFAHRAEVVALSGLPSPVHSRSVNPRFAELQRKLFCLLFR